MMTFFLFFFKVELFWLVLSFKVGFKVEIRIKVKLGLGARKCTYVCIN